MDVKQIYNAYKIPPNLQKHMLRVAALSHIIIKNWRANKLDKESIILTCLFHDMANIIKFDFKKPSLFKEEENQLDYWKKVRDDFLQKYGTDIHKATLNICQEIGLTKQTLQLIEELEWNNSLNKIQQNDFESMICIYSDMRIGPHGILPLQERLINLQTRNSSFDFEFIEKSAVALEKEVQKHISISVNSINDTELNEKFEQLLRINI